MTKESKNKGQANESTEVELYLENEVFYLLIQSLKEDEKELSPIAVGKDEELANEMFNLAVSLGLIAGTNLLHTIVNSRSLTKVYGLAGATMVNIDELRK